MGRDLLLITFEIRYSNPHPIPREMDTQHADDTSRRLELTYMATA